MKLQKLILAKHLSMKEVGRQNFWYQTEPEYDAATETWKQTWDYVRRPINASLLMMGNGGKWTVENHVWVLGDEHAAYR